MINTESAPGNAQVVALFERLLALAREGRVGYAFAGVCAEGKGIFADAGVTLLEPVGVKLAKQVTAVLEARAHNRTLPARDPALDAAHVCYDVPNGPLSYDFIAWLIDAEMTRIREGAPGPLKVGFWFGRDGTTGLDLPSRRQMFEGVVRPALALIGALEVADTGGRHKPFYCTRDIVAAARAGEAVPRFAAPSWIKDQFKFERPPVVITLREASHWPHRNSNLDAWLRFAEYLSEHGETVIFVRDTAKADEPFPFATYPDASRDLTVRLALYEAAAWNCFVSNGPGALALFSHVPFVQFVALQQDDHPYQPDTAKFHRDNMGLEPGEQYPWLQAHQRICWAPDTFENIMAAWQARTA